MNRVELIGRLTRDPEVRGEGDKMVAHFTVAVDRFGSQDKTADFISCVAFRKTAELMQKYVFRGSRIGVEGRIQTGSYTKQDGTKVYTTDVIADRVEFLDSRNQQQDQAPAQAAEQTGQWMDVPDTDNEELPFH